MDDPLRAVLNLTTRFRHDRGYDRDYQPAGVRVHPDVAYTFARTADQYAVYPTYDPSGRFDVHRLFGLTVIEDEYMPPGVIRIVDTYGRLCADSRSGQKVPR